MTARYPVDSAEAAEMREHPDVDTKPHHRCSRGWTGEDEQGRPIPCRLCHPKLGQPRPSCTCPDCRATNGPR